MEYEMGYFLTNFIVVFSVLSLHAFTTQEGAIDFLAGCTINKVPIVTMLNAKYSKIHKKYF